MRKHLLLIITLFGGIFSLSAKEEEEKSLSSEERTQLIRENLSKRPLELVIDPWGGDGVECKQFELTSSGYQTTSNSPKVKFERGYTFSATGFIDGYLYMFEHEGKHYGVSMSDVQFKNSEDAELLSFMLRKKSQKLNSFGGRFYGTSAALWTMLFIMGTAAIISLIYLKGKSATLRPIVLTTVPAAILLFSAIEIFGYIKFGSDMFWWCEYERYGFWGSLFRVIPFAAMVAAQVFSIKIYERALFDNNEATHIAKKDRKISLKPAAWSLAICIPATLAVIIIVALCGLNNSIFMDIAGIATFLGSLGTGLYLSFKRNVKTFGAATGLWITLFSVVYIIGCLISALAMIILIFKIIFQILVVIGTAFILLMIANTKQRRRVYRGGTVYEVED